MNNQIMNADTRTGAIAGTSLALLVTVDGGELLSTIILAAAGALASFFVSVACRCIRGRTSRRGKLPDN